MPLNVVINSLTTVAITIFFIQVVQQFLPNMAVFGVYEEELGKSEVAEIRNGLYRYRLSCQCVTFFCLYYYWQQTLEKYTLKSAILSVILMASIYLTLTRQLIVAGAICMLSVYVMRNLKVSIWGGISCHRVSRALSRVRRSVWGVCSRSEQSDKK